MTRTPDHRVNALNAIADRMLGDMAGHAVAQRLHADVKRLHTSAEALDRANASRNPLETPAAHTKRIATMARRLDQEITASLNRAGEALRIGTQDIQRRIAEKVDLRPDAFAAEIRAAFRVLDHKAKMELLDTLVKENRGPELAAIVNAPSVLSGIDDTRKEVFKQAIIHKHAAAEIDEQTKLNDVFDAAMTAARVTGNLTKELTDPGRLAAIERGEAAANAAGAAFDQALQ